MANEPQLTVVGNLVADPELRYTPSGAAVTNFRVAQTPRRFDKQSNEYVDGEALFMTCNVWREAAENVANSLTKGDRVIVTGKLRQRSYENNEGEKRTIMELEVDAVGPDLRYATTQVTKTPRQGGNFGGQQQPQGNQGGYGQQPPQGNTGGWNQGQQQPPQTNQQQGGGWNRQQPQSGQQPPQQGGFGGRPNNMTQQDDDPWNSYPQGQQGAFPQGNDNEPPF